MYVTDVNQQDWDEYAERLTFAINTAQDRVRGDTPFYLIHGWDQQRYHWEVLRSVIGSQDGGDITFKININAQEPQ